MSLAPPKAFWSYSPSRLNTIPQTIHALWKNKNSYSPSDSIHSMIHPLAIIKQYDYMHPSSTRDKCPSLSF